MAIASAANGDPTLVLDTETTLTTQTTAGVYQLVTDLSNLATGDTLILRIKTKYYPGATSRLAFEEVFTNAQGEPNKYSPPIAIDTEILCTAEQTDGTGRQIFWNLLKVS